MRIFIFFGIFFCRICFLTMDVLVVWKKILALSFQDIQDGSKREEIMFSMNAYVYLYME